MQHAGCWLCPSVAARGAPTEVCSLVIHLDSFDTICHCLDRLFCLLRALALVIPIAITIDTAITVRGP
jgi:hypothetical protein